MFKEESKYWFWEYKDYMDKKLNKGDVVDGISMLAHLQSGGRAIKVGWAHSIDLQCPNALYLENGKIKSGSSIVEEEELSSSQWILA